METDKIRIYADWIETVIRPWLKESVINERIASADGTELNCYYAVNPAEKAAVVMIHGFCEFFGKYHETAWRFYQAGYSVFFAELRGHAKSGRTAESEDQLVHVGSFREYEEDVLSFVDQIVIPNSLTGHLYLFAHSMGGAVGALLMEEKPDLFQCAVLSSPMLKLSFGRVPSPAVTAIGVYADLRNRTEYAAPGQGAFPPEYRFDESSSLSEERYLYQFDQRLADADYRTWGGTIGWVKAAREAADLAVRNIRKIRTPVLLCQASDDTTVDNEGQNIAAAGSDRISLLRFEGSKHEIYNAPDPVREKYYRDILVFYRTFQKRSK